MRANWDELDNRKCSVRDNGAINNTMSSRMEHFSRSQRVERERDPTTPSPRIKSAIPCSLYINGREDEHVGMSGVASVLCTSFCLFARFKGNITKLDEMTVLLKAFSHSVNLQLKGEISSLPLPYMMSGAGDRMKKVLFNFKRFTKLSYYSIESAVAGVEGVKHRNPFL